MDTEVNILDHTSEFDLVALYDGFLYVGDCLDDLLIRQELLNKEIDDVSYEVESIKEFHGERNISHAKRSNEVEKVTTKIDQLSNEINHCKSELKQQKDTYRSLLDEYEDFGEENQNDLDIGKVARQISGKINTAELGIDKLEGELSKFSEFLNLTRPKENQLEYEIEKAREERAKVSNATEQVERMIGKLESREREANAVLQEKVDDFDELLESLYWRKSDVEKMVDEVEDLKETASNLVKGQAGASIGRQFEERKTELRKSVIVWGIGSTISILLLLSSAVFMYLNIIRGDVDGIASISSVALILPISVAVWFTSSNYTRQKRLMDEYEFKANMALSLMGFREVLKEDIPKGEKAKVGEFIIETMDKIYSNPQENVSNSNKEYSDDPLTPGQKSLVQLIEQLNK